MADTRKNFFFNIRVETSDTTRALAELEVELQRVNKQVREARKAGDVDAYEKFRAGQLKLREEAKLLRKDLRETEKAFRKSKFPEDSLIGLREQYRKLREEINKLSAAEREGDLGQLLIRKARGVKQQIDDIGASVRDFRSNVGNYQESVEKAINATGGLLGGDLGGVLGGLGIGGAYGAAISATIGLVTEAVGEVTELVTQFAALRKEVEAVTGLTGDALGEASARVSAIAKQFDQDVQEIVVAANAAAKGFGVDFTEALDAVEVGLLKGLDANGEFIDNLREYPSLLDNAGFTLDEFLKLSQVQLQEGIYDDKLIDTIKELDLALKELTTTQVDALAPLGQDFVKDFGDRIAAGTLNTREAIFEIAERANEVGLNIQQIQTITADVFKSAGEDAGGFEKVISSVYKAIRDENEKLSDSYTAAQESARGSLEIQKEFERATEELTNQLNPLISDLSTFGQQIQVFLLEKLVLLVEYFEEAFSPINEIREEVKELRSEFESAGPAVSFLTKALNPLRGIFKVIQVSIQATIETINKAIKAINFVLDISRQVREFIVEFLDDAGVLAALEKVNGYITNVTDRVKELGRQLGVLRETKEPVPFPFDQSKYDAFGDSIIATNKGVADLSKGIKGLGEDSEETDDKLDKLARGSLAFVRAKLAELQKQLEGTPVGSEAYEKLLDQIDRAKQNLQALEQVANRITRQRQGNVSPVSALDNSGQQAVEQDFGLLTLGDRAEIEREQALQDKLKEVRENAAKSQREFEASERDKRLEILQKEREERVEILQEFGGQLGQTIAEFSQGQIESFRDFQRAILGIALEALEKEVSLAIVRITAKELGSKSFAGIATAAVLGGIVKGLFSAARSAIQNFAVGGLVEDVESLPDGGKVAGRQNMPRMANGDRVLAALTPGEAVLNNQQILRGKMKYGPDFLKALGVPGFAGGGLVLPTPNFVGPQQVINNSTQVAQDRGYLREQAELIASKTKESVREGIAEGMAEAQQRNERRESLRKRSTF